MDLEFQESWRTSINIGIWGQNTKCAAIKIKLRYQHLIKQHKLYSNNPLQRFLHMELQETNKVSSFNNLSEIQHQLYTTFSNKYSYLLSWKLPVVWNKEFIMSFRQLSSLVMLLLQESQWAGRIGSNLPSLNAISWVMLDWNWKTSGNTPIWELLNRWTS